MSGEIRLVGDSFGGPRLHWDVVEVPEESTWPRQVQREFAGGTVQFDFKPFRRIVECPKLLADQPECRLAIVQAGIVDCFPRPMNQAATRSSHLFYKVLRRVIRPIRREWTNYLYQTTWSSRDEIVSALETLFTQHPTRLTGIVTAAPLRKEHSLPSPGAQEAIFEYNDLVRETAKRFPRAFVIDIHSASLAYGHQRVLSSWDSHLSQEGNDWFAKMVLQQIEVQLGTCPELKTVAGQKMAA